MRIDFVWWSLVAIGVILRLRQYLNNRSLWADEASLALNLVNRTFGSLMQPLDYHQAAPIGFLFIEKLSIVLLGNKDYVLRLFPLFSGIIATYLIYRIAREYFGAAGIFAVLMFAINSWLIFFSSELKQYSTDVTVTLLLFYLSSRCFKEDTEARDYLWLGLAGIITIWLSHVSIFILAGIGLALALDKFIRKEYAAFVWLFGLGASWFISFGIEYVVSLQYTAADEYFQTYWRKDFMPVPPWSDLSWFLKTYYSFLLIMWSRTDPILFWMIPALVVIGSLSFFIRNRSTALVIILPFIIALVASAFQKYPLSYRFMLFLIPPALLLVNEGIRSIYLLIAKWHRSPALLLSGIPVVVMLWYTVPTTFGVLIHPQTISEIKPVMKYVGEKRTQEDVIYVYYGSTPAYLYYAPFYDLDSGNIVIGADSPRKKIALEYFFDDVEKLRGNNRVWFVFSDLVDCGGCVGDKRVFFVNYLNGFGRMLDKVENIESGAYLYELNP